MNIGWMDERLNIGWEDERMKTGWMEESIYAITGVPTFQMRHKSYTPERAWTLIKEFDQKEYIMASSNFNKDFGLNPGHAYSFIGTAEYNGVKLV
jgi:hypothetical protein